MDDNTLFERVRSMLFYRKYTEVLSRKIGDGRFVHGKGLPKDHIRYGTEVLFLIDFTPTYSMNRISRLISLLNGELKKLNLPPDSSIGMVFRFNISASQQAFINTQVKEIPFEFELFTDTNFIVDHSVGKFAKRWRIVGGKDIEFLPGKLVDKPPKMRKDDIMVKYLGARDNDYIMFDRLEIGETGPRTYPMLKQVASIYIEASGEEWEEIEIEED